MIFFVVVVVVVFFFVFVLICVAFSNLSSKFWSKGQNALIHVILVLRIPSKNIYFKHLWNRNQGQNGLTHIVLLRLWISFINNPPLFFISNFFKETRIRDNTVWPVLSFQENFEHFSYRRANLIWSSRPLFSFRRILVKKQISNFVFWSKQDF